MSGALRRELGLFGAVITGLGSILGTGVFVSIAVAADSAGDMILYATPLAALVATFNGLSSAQLAAAHPVAGGTYEYGYRFLHPWMGYTAGWLFLVAKTASASTAALGFAGYALALIGADDTLVAPVAVGAAVAVTSLVLSGIRRTAGVNAVLVAVTVGALVSFVIAGLVEGTGGRWTLTIGVEDPAWNRLLTATAFMFVAYTGYGRIATLGEEVREPARIIPRAVIITLAVSAVIYTTVAAVGWNLAGPAWGLAARLNDAPGAPLAGLLASPAAARVVEVGAIVAMLGVLLNLVLGLSRVWLAMGRRRDMPARLAHVSPAGSPAPAVIVTGALIAAVTVVGDVRLTWSFSAMTVLLYYAITNWAALRLPPDLRRFPRWISWAGLASCLLLSFFVELAVWLTGAAVIALGLAWRIIVPHGVGEGAPGEPGEPGYR
jgi:APA family basic amino acid/polyamine antiporter